MRTLRSQQGEITPSKIVCVGRNYVAHIEELGNAIPEQMVLFLKPNSAIGEGLASQREGEPLHYEAELCFLVEQGRFAAVAIGLDLTRRQLQSRLKKAGLPWERAKAFDGSAVFGAFVPVPDPLPTLALELAIDGRIVQVGDTSLMLYPPTEILAEVQRCMTLEDGDIVMTGTPAGVGEVPPGARFEGKVRVGEDVLATAEWTAAS
ncbi:MAG: fumarylacetoacetate hydrolase family protein [Pseudomonadota bacterium]